MLISGDVRQLSQLQFVIYVPISAVVDLDAVEVVDQQLLLVEIVLLLVLGLLLVIDSALRQVVIALHALSVALASFVFGVPLAG